MTIIPRAVLPELLSELRRPEISILLGPRQVGKTFLLRQLERSARKTGLKTYYFDLELPEDLRQFNRSDAEIITMLMRRPGVVFIDEFHYIKNASRIFKAVFDSRRRVKIYASGSSSIEIHKHLKESLAGRRLVTRIMPLSLEEFRRKSPSKSFNRLLPEYAAFGGLPGLLRSTDNDGKERILSEILQTYIQKDVKALIREENVRAFNHLLYLIAENQGALVSENSLAREVGLTAVTVHRHLNILENTYVCLPVYSYARNLGNELKKSKKLYFYDLGMRNVLLKDFRPPQTRPDKGVVAESLVFLELARRLRPSMELRFWRTKAGQEIDFILLRDRVPFPIEVKSGPSSPEIPQAFRTFFGSYPEASGGLVLSEAAPRVMEFQGKQIQFAPLEAIPDLVKDLSKL